MMVSSNSCLPSPFSAEKGVGRQELLDQIIAHMTPVIYEEEPTEIEYKIGQNKEGTA